MTTKSIEAFSLFETYLGDGVDHQFSVNYCFGPPFSPPAELIRPGLIRSLEQSVAAKRFNRIL
jgi:hypothetical protein